ncbi:uncharacterized protein LOC134677886 isoform X2 [Cydia fagiglandana]|uniref:uncharacterized protein LOC134677886 isoform X2 n=1 Tax=Cydia fagiglandana TaxID=1458189 RepID=UPI002FEDF215
MNFSCKIAGKPGDLISWYQKKDSHRGLILLHRTQLMNSDSINFTLQWTPEQSDNNTQIYCVHEDLNKNTSTGFNSPITITFSNNIAPRKSSVTVTPDENAVYYEINKTLSLVCNGTDPVDGQELTWYIQGDDSKLQLAEKQSFNRTTNINNLVMRLDKTHNRKQLFCAQDFHFQRLPTADGAIIDRYRELAKSKIIKLVHKNSDNEIGDNNNNIEQGKDSNLTTSEDDAEDGNKAEKNIGKGTNGSPWLRFPLVVVIPVAVIAVAAVLAAVWFRCGRRAKTEDGHDNNEDSTEVTYAALDFVPKKDAPPNIPPSTDSKSSGEVTYAALAFSARPEDTPRLRIDQSSDYATIMASQAFTGQS